MTATVYVLKDPFTDAIRYVGSTKQLLSTRLSAHCSNVPDNNKGAWIKELLEKGVRPVIEEIERVELEVSLERELYWIELYKQQGCELLNNNTIKDTTSFDRGGGRKPVEERKVPLNLFVEPELIAAAGGKEEARRIACEAIYAEAKRLKRIKKG